MIYHSDTVLDPSGVPVSGASVGIYLRNTNTLASLYMDFDGVTRANPMTTDAVGFFEFWADPGQYEVRVTPAGGTTTTRTLQLAGAEYMHFVGTAVAASTTTSLTPTGETATSGDAEFNTLGQAIVSRVFIQVTAAPGSGRSYTYNLYVGAVATPLTISNIETEKTFRPSLMYTPAGTPMLVELVTPAGAPTATHRVTLELSP